MFINKMKNNVKVIFYFLKFLKILILKNTSFLKLKILKINLINF